MDFLDKAYSGLVRQFVFPLHERLKGHQTTAMLREMMADQWLSSAELRQLQERRLRTLIEHAAQKTRYYAALFQELNLRPGDIQTVSDLGKLPLLSKDIIRERLDDLKSSEAKHVQRFATGGSTGQPLIFYLGSTRVSSDVASRCRAEGWWTVGIPDREYVIWGSPVELSKQDRMRGLRDSIFRTRLFSAFEMNAATMSCYLDEMERTGCRRVFGYPSSIALLCERAKAEGRDLRKLGVKAVFVTAEYLWDHWRDTISRSFGCAVANGYGGRDSGFIAHECPAGGMHVTADRMIVEVVDGGGQALPPGQSGEIVVTHFDTPEMPFIRYRTGDVGVLSAKTCSCGRGLPLLERVEGRTTDFILAPDGRVMHGLSLVYVLREIAGIEQFRILQKTPFEFNVQIVRTASYDATSEQLIRQAFCSRMRAQVTVKIEYPEKIACSASGKFRYVISEVNPNQFNLAGEEQTRSGPVEKIAAGPVVR